MTKRPQNPSVRRAARVLALMPAVVVTGAAGAAFADTPAAWPDNPPVSTWHVILILVVIPVALFVGITFLAMLPSMRKGQGYHPGEAWRGEPEWFGGPRGGTETLEAGAPAAAGRDQSGSQGGGASGSW